MRGLCHGVAQHPDAFDLDFDHIAGHHEFPERWVHRAEADILARPTRLGTLAEPYATEEAFDALPPPHPASTDIAAPRIAVFVMIFMDVPQGFVGEKVMDAPARPQQT